MSHKGEDPPWQAAQKVLETYSDLLGLLMVYHGVDMMTAAGYILCVGCMAGQLLAVGCMIENILAVGCMVGDILAVGVQGKDLGEECMVGQVVSVYCGVGQGVDVGCIAQQILVGAVVVGLAGLDLLFG